jgi:hypothetical protein
MEQLTPTLKGKLTLVARYTRFLRGFTHKRQKAAMPKARLPVQASDHRERDKQVVASLG